MRILSQNGKIDIPYELSVLTIERYLDIDSNMEPMDSYAIYAEVSGKKYTMAKYKNKEDCVDKFNAIHTASSHGIETGQLPSDDTFGEYKIEVERNERKAEINQDASH